MGIKLDNSGLWFISRTNSSRVSFNSSLNACNLSYVVNNSLYVVFNVF